MERQRTLAVGIGMFLVGVLLQTAPVGAHIPAPQNCTLDAVLVGDAGGGSGVSFTVIPRDISYYPLDFIPVTLKFMNTGLVLLEDQEPGTIVDCVGRTLERYTDQNGLVVFHPRFGGILGTDELEVRANRVLIATIRARSTDSDGNGVTDLADLNRFRDALMLGGNLATPFDYNIDGIVSTADLDILRRDLFFGSPGSVCP